MPAPDIAIVKAWCRIDGAEFDAILPTLIDEATARASHETGVDYVVEVMPSGVKAWVASQVAFWIENPAAANDKPLAPSPYLARLLDPYRTYQWTPPAA